MKLSSGRKRDLEKLSKGSVLLLVVGLVALISAMLIGFMVISNEESQHKNIKSAQDGMDQARAFVLDYLRQNHELPSVSTFQTGTSTLTDAWGRKILYFPSDDLLSGDVCSVTATDITLNDCANSLSCLSPRVISNIPFLIVSGGEYVNSVTDPIFQTAPAIYKDSASITSPVIFKQYRPRLNVGTYLDPNAGLAVYDDLLQKTSLAEIYSTAGCLSKSQGDVQQSGGVLKILNTLAELPAAACQTPYYQTIPAYGRNGTYTWAMTALPTGLTYTTSGTTTIISGEPTVEGAYNFTATVTDSVGRTDSRIYNIDVTSTWQDTVNNGCSGAVITKEQTNSCPGVPPRWVTTGVVSAWADTIPPVIQYLTCGTGLTGQITQKQQTQSCGSATQWVATDNTCTTLATVDGRFSVAAGQFSGVNLGTNTITIGSGTGSITVSASSNLTRHTTSGFSSTPAFGVAGGTDAVDSGQTLNFAFGGSARKLGIEFRGLQNNKGFGADRIENAIIVFKNTLTTPVSTVATYTVSGCQSGDTVGSTFSLPELSSAFNRVEVTAGSSPSSTDFFIRGIKTCDAGVASCKPTGASTTTCPYP